MVGSLAGNPVRKDCHVQGAGICPAALTIAYIELKKVSITQKDLLRRLSRKDFAESTDYWIKQGWIHSRRTPSGKHLIVWADKDELRRLKRLARVKQSWLRARHPDLIIPKRRSTR
jgi:hypothetical protein